MDGSPKRTPTLVVRRQWKAGRLAMESEALAYRHLLAPRIVHLPAVDAVNTVNTDRPQHQRRRTAAAGE
jgi:hypothetical protein